MIELTAAAIAEVARIRAQDTGNTKLRLTLGEGTCEKFYYQLALTSEAVAEDITAQIGDLVILVDSQYRQYLENIQVDFAQDLMGGGFRFQNPQAVKVCDCGNAFSA
jgi:iron-sulfur cluster assembly protein